MDSFASGNWLVNPGSEAEFINRWEAFLQWAASGVPGLIEASLLQDAADPRHFISFAQWKSLDALNDWRSRPEFAEKIGACRALCEDFKGGNYMRVKTIAG